MTLSPNYDVIFTKFTLEARQGLAYANAMAHRRGCRVIFGLHLLSGMALVIKSPFVQCDFDKMRQLAEPVQNDTALGFSDEVVSCFILLWERCMSHFGKTGEMKDVSAGPILVALYDTGDDALRSSFSMLRVDIGLIRSTYCRDDLPPHPPAPK